MLFSWCCRWFFPITSPAVQELDRKVTMAEQIATMRYLMNAFMFWFMIFFCPLLSFASETTRFEAWSLVFNTFLFSQSGRYFSPTGQVILRAFWITMQRYEIPIYQVCDCVRYHAIAEHFLQNTHHLTLNVQHWKSPRSQRFYRWSVTRQVNINH